MGTTFFYTKALTLSLFKIFNVSNLKDLPLPLPNVSSGSTITNLRASSRSSQILFHAYCIFRYFIAFAY